MTLIIVNIDAIARSAVLHSFAGYGCRASSRQTCNGGMSDAQLSDVRNHLHPTATHPFYMSAIPVGQHLTLSDGAHYHAWALRHWCQRK